MPQAREVLAVKMSRVGHVAGLLILAGFSGSPAPADVLSMPAGQASSEFVTVGSPRNIPDARYNNLFLGAVTYTYQIGKFDVTAGQYCQFLNAVARNDIYGLYSPYMADTSGQGCGIQRTGEPGACSYSVAAEYANRPVNFVSWGSAARFCNWLTNDQPVGRQGLATTEDGSYFLNGATSINALQVVQRRAGARYVLPDEDEWYKAAYYDPNKPGVPGYWDYPTRSDATPSSTLDPAGYNNANFASDDDSAKPANCLTLVGQLTSSPGPYGTFDQGGNVWQWTETSIYGPCRILRGGSFKDGNNNLHASNRYGQEPTREDAHIGFRIARVTPGSSTTSHTARSVFSKCAWRFQATGSSGIRTALCPQIAQISTD